MDARSIAESISGTFDVLNILLVFLSVIFGITYNEAVRLLDASIPDAAKVRERQIARKNIRRFLLVKWLPLVVTTAGTTYIFLPLAVRVLATSQLHFWDFDIQRTSFILVFILLVIALIWMLAILVQLVLKILAHR